VPDIFRLLAGMKVCGCVPSLACSIRSAKDARQKQQGTAHLNTIPWPLPLAFEDPVASPSAQ